MTQQNIGSLPPTLQGIALDLKVGEKVAITTDEHHSASHGDHFDVYIMTRLSEAEVMLFKSHSDKLLAANNAWSDILDKAATQPLTESEKENFPPVGGC